MLSNADILTLLPHQNPFRFVDEITFVDENSIEGHYTFLADAFFYQGHFPSMPITPAVILTECAAQIGLVCFGIYLLNLQGIPFDNKKWPLFTSSNMQYYKKVFPGEKLFVRATKTVFRHGKLRSTVEMIDIDKNLVCDGQISGMFV